MKIKILKDGYLPSKGKIGDVAWDIFLPYNVTIRPNSTVVIDSRVCVQIPNGYAGMLVIRSSLSKTGLIIQPPLIDSNYRGEIHIIVVNNTKDKFEFYRKERLCSLLVFPIINEELEIVDELDENIYRGDKWSGSSGK